MNRIDLHLHSCHSDGTLTPAQVASMAADQGLMAIALADHDTVSGIDECISSGERHRIEVIPAVELSVEYGGYRDIHLLGYFIDHRDTSFLEKLEQFRVRRMQRGAEIIDRINGKLRQEGKPCISYADVLSQSVEALGRPHIARVLVAQGCASSMEDAFDRYLIPCDVPKLYFPLHEAISEIKRIGGLSVLAHPTSITRDRSLLRELLIAFTGLGLDGLETYNTLCSADERDFLLGIARHYRLAVTGGSDFHGNEDDDRMGIGGNRGPITYELVQKLKERLDEVRAAMGT
ncbi:MAG: PHP domain-containing protein [Geobacter sp.]|nr:PHP domain-containing protein [Geobacter sp.]